MTYMAGYARQTPIPIKIMYGHGWKSRYDTATPQDTWPLGVWISKIGGFELGPNVFNIRRFHTGSCRFHLLS